MSLREELKKIQDSEMERDLNELLMQKLSIAGFEPKNNDDMDHHELHILQLKELLEAAWLAGRKENF